MSLSRAVQLLTAQPITAAGDKIKRLPPPSVPEARFALSYMDSFGYLEKSLAGWKDIRLEDIAKAIGLFQGWFGLRRSAQLDPQTVKAMEWPRCGHCDIARGHNVQAVVLTEFVSAQLPRWTKDGLTYAFKAFVPGIGKDEQRKLAARAFGSWTRYGNISVAETGGSKADILIGTGQGARSNFDGPGGTLAWAYLPDGSNNPLEMRFDLGETWVSDPASRGILYLNVAAHEFGHLFGLDHSKRSGALMAPYYNPAVNAPQKIDDVSRFQKLYGVRKAAVQAAVRKTVVLHLTGPAEIEVDGRTISI